MSQVERESTDGPAPSVATDIPTSAPAGSGPQLQSLLRNSAVPWVIAAVLGAGWFFASNDYSKTLGIKNAEIEKLQGQLSSTIEEARDAKRDFEQKLDAARQATAAAREASDIANRPEATFVIRKAKEANLFSKDEYYIAIQNISPRDTPVKLIFRRPSTNQEKSYDFVVRGGETTRLFERDGWTAISEDTVEVIQPGHKTKSLQFN